MPVLITGWACELLTDYSGTLLEQTSVQQTLITVKGTLTSGRPA